MLKPTSLAPPKTGRSRFSKALPELPLFEPFEFEPFSLTSESATPTPTPTNAPTNAPAPAPAPVPAPVPAPMPVPLLVPHPTTNTKDLPPASSPPSTALPALPVPAETYVRPRLPPQPQQQAAQPQPAAEPTKWSPQRKAAPPSVPPMSFPRRPVAKPAANLPTEPASPSGSLSSLLSAYSRSSGESLIRSSDGGGDGTGNSSLVATLSPEREGAMNGFPLPPRSASFLPKENHPAQESAAQPKPAFSLPPRSASFLPKESQPVQESAAQPKPAFSLPPRSASLAPKDGQPVATRNGLILPSSNAIPPPPPLKDEGRSPDSQRGGSSGAPSPATPLTQNGLNQPTNKTMPPRPLPAKDEGRAPDAQQEGGSNEPGSAPASAAPQSGMRSRSSSQATSELWARRTARSNHSHDGPELKLTISHDRPSEDSQVLPHLSTSAAPSASLNSPARPLEPVYSAYTPASAKNQSPLPPLPSHPAEASQQSVDEKMGQRSSKMKEKLQMIRGGVSKHLKGSPSQGEVAVPSPLSQQLTPVSRGTGGESTSVSPLSSEMQQGEEQGQVRTQQMQMQQQQQQQHQQQQHQRAPSHQKPIGPSTLHAARSLPDMKAPVPQTSSERPPPISSEYDHPQNSPVPQQTPQEQPPAEQKFPPRTSSTRAPPPLAQKQQLPERGRPRAGSAATFDGRAPSLDRRIGRVSSNPSLVDYAAPPPRTRVSDTIYREVNQDDLPPPDPRAMYFPQQTTQPTPAASTVFAAPEVKDAHKTCFQRHAKMIMARNKYYPLACMVCGVEDAELRWQCAWCRLRVCGGCVRLLQGFDRDLEKVLEHVAARGPGADGDESRSSGGSRPGSEGLEKVVETQAEEESARPV